MTTSMNVSLDTNFDLNSVFSLQYNFDMLKAILESLLKSQKNNNQKINEFEDKLEQKDKKISKLQNDLDYFNIFFKNIQGNTEGNFNNSNSKGKDGGNMSQDLIMTIMSKISFLESQNNLLNIYGSDLKEVKKNVSSHDDTLKLHQGKFDEVFWKLNELNEKFGNMNYIDFFDKKLSVTESSGDGKFEITINLVKNLESKLSTLMNTDKKIEDDINFLKKELSTVKLNLSETDKIVTSHKDDISSIYSRLNDYKKDIVSMNNLNRGTYQDMLDKLNTELEKKFLEIDIKLNSFAASNANNISLETNEADTKLLKDLLKRVAELEKNLKIFSTTINIELINKELANIKEALSNKIGQVEFKEIKDNYGKNNILNALDTLGQLLNVINFIKDSIIQLQEDNKKLSDDYTILKRKIDNLTMNLMQNKTSDDSIRDRENLSSKLLVYENTNNSRYLEVNIFNDFKTQILKEIDTIKFSINDLKSLIEDILNKLKTKADSKDLAGLEILFLTRIEELKSACNKKFADKNEIAKNLKYLDTQIKHIIDVNIKRMDKGDNWLLAKKPLEGFNCASCEAYIGDLKENNEHIAWNKYPMRDPSDKLYRMGNGFSKMLQYLNIDGYMNHNASNMNNMNLNNQNGNINVQNKKNFTSVDFYKRKPDSTERKEQKLPKVKTNKKNVMNVSGEDIEVLDENENIDDPMQPKIMKIYKKNKA